MKIEQQQIKAFLMDSGLVAKVDVEKAEKDAKTEGKKIEDVLQASGKITADEISHLKGYILGFPFVNLEKEKIDPKALEVVPEPIARKHNIVAYKKTGTTLEVAMLDPEDLETIDFIKKKSNLTILPRLTSEAAIKHVLSQYQKSLEAEFGDIIKTEGENLTAGVKKEGGTEEITAEDLKKIAEDLPIVRIVDTLIRHAILQRASDVHIEPMEREVLVRYRIDGILHDAMVLPKQVASGIVARIKVLSSLKLDEHRLPQDGRFKIATDEYKYSFRVSILPVFDGEKVVLRLLPEDIKGFTLEELGFHGEQLENLHKEIKKPVGMVLATGPTGSGKTTTLYSVLHILNVPGVNISTVEDPVEYRMPRVNQTQIRSDIGLSFANGLRTLVRQDPDIIMVGEIRDNETADLAVNAALTGHLVLSTLHTNSAAGALPRLLEMKVEPFLTASTVNVIIGQRLVRTLCKDSSEKYFLSEAEMKDLEEVVSLDRVLKFLKDEKIVAPKASWKDIPFYKPKPSSTCPDGYSGRIGIHEALKMSPTIKELLMKNATADEIEKQAKTEGMMTMSEDGFFKATQGITTIEEVLRVTRE
ncbi:Flp pilus assembly complex ATPase component TadA [Candidatus Giovannonibacteria bacterium]|nr:Flp pilus assembly complex ATPase component TadA [Candidatus Giovannonibacteria bacterium]